MVTIKEIADKQTWEAFLNNKEIIYYPFFQSWEWGQIQIETGNKIWRLGVYENKKLVGIAQIVDINARRGHYFHFRHGPVLMPFNQTIFDLLLEHVKKLAKENNAVFLRISPLVKKEYVDNKVLQQRNFREAPVHNMDAEVCWVLDITKKEEELLQGMRKTHRQLIKKAKTMEINVIKTKEIEKIADFLPLYSNLSQRKHFVPHKGVKEEFSAFSKEDQELLLLAEYKGKIISGAIIAFVGNMAIYRHGASDSNFRDIPASYLLQWEAILEAKKRGMKLYNFWGIAPDNKPNHPWKGLSLFKTGFGGETLEFLHAKDLPLSPLYWKTYLIEKYSTWKKGY